MIEYFKNTINIIFLYHINNESYYSFNYWDQRILSNYPGFLHFPNIYHLHLFTIILKERKKIISRIHSSDNSEHPYLFIMFVKKRKKDSRSHPQWFRSLWITELIIQECDFDGISQICTFDISHHSFGNLYIIDSIIQQKKDSITFTKPMMKDFTESKVHLSYMSSKLKMAPWDLIQYDMSLWEI